MASIIEPSARNRRTQASPPHATAASPFAVPPRDFQPRHLLAGLPGKTPLAWGLIADDDRQHSETCGRVHPQTLELVHDLAGCWLTTRSPAPKLHDRWQRWLDDAVASPLTTSLAIEQLAWAHALPHLLPGDAGGPWWSAAQQLAAMAGTSDQAATADTPLLLRQLAAAEFPLTLAGLFGPRGSGGWLDPPPPTVFLDAMQELFNGAPLPRSGYLQALRPLAACWTRCHAIAAEALEGWWNAPLEAAYQKVVAGLVRLARHDGTQVLDPFLSGDSSSACELVLAAVGRAGSRAERALAELLITRPKGQPLSRGPSVRRPALSVNSEDSCLAVLRSDLSSRADMLAVAYRANELSVELAAAGQVLWSGAADPQVTFNDRLLQPESDWEEVCWVSDEDVDYLELQLLLTGGLRIERHLLLAREGRFAFLADALIGDAPGRIQYTATLPLAAGIQPEPPGDFHEVCLAGGKRLCRLLPLALGEWRSDAAAGTLVHRQLDGRSLIELRQSARHAQALFAPLFIDLAPARLSRPLTWRRLTVAEDRKVQPPDMAVGYRVQLGRQQWLLYRSLIERGNRSILGHNLVSEFLVATFSRAGKVEPLLEIE